MLESIDSKAYSEKNMLLFLSLYPDGLTHDDIALLCEMFKEWFGDYKPLKERMFKTGKTAPVFNQIS